MNCNREAPARGSPVNSLDLLLDAGAEASIRIGGREKSLAHIDGMSEIHWEEVMKHMAHAAVFRLTQENIPPAGHRYGAAGVRNHRASVPLGHPLAAPFREKQGAAPERRVRFQAPPAHCGIFGFRAQEMPENHSGRLKGGIANIRKSPAQIAYCAREPNLFLECEAILAEVRKQRLGFRSL
ncbi:MAG: hypothetical protein QM757_09690 [Paludibaculum sp.]